MEIISRLNTTDGVLYTVQTTEGEVKVVAESDEEALERADNLKHLINKEEE